MDMLAQEVLKVVVYLIPITKTWYHKSPEMVTYKISLFSSEPSMQSLLPSFSHSLGMQGPENPFTVETPVWH